MKEDVRNIAGKLEPTVNAVKHNRIKLFGAIVICTYMFLAFQIIVLTNKGPDDDLLNQELETAQEINFDQEAIDKILSLEAQNIEVKTLFRQARNNPFND